MFEAPGIDADDVAWIERDQFVYFTEVERELSDPNDWRRFKHDMARALTTALALPPSRDADDTGPSVAGTPQLLRLLNEARQRHDPAIEWKSFQDWLWHQHRSFGVFPTSLVSFDANA